MTASLPAGDALPSTASETASEVERIGRLLDAATVIRLLPSDVLVLELARPVPADVASDMTDALRAILGRPTQEIVVLIEGHLRVVRVDDDQAFERCVDAEAEQ